MDLLGTLFDSATGGGIVGAIGGLGRAWMDMKLEKFRAEYAEKKDIRTAELEKARWAHDRALTALELQHKEVIAEREVRKELELADMGAMMESFNADKRAYTTDEGATKHSGWFVFVDVWRGIIRPGITTYFSTLYSLLAIYITYQLFTVYPEMLSKDWIVTEFKSIVGALTFVTTTVVLWWFAARGTSMSRR